MEIDLNLGDQEPPPTRPTTSSSNELLQFDDSLSTQIYFASSAGITDFQIFLTPQNGVGSIPKKPILLKKALENIIDQPTDIKHTSYTRQGKLFINTSKSGVARKLCSVSSVFEVPVSPSIYLENLTSRFLLHNIPVDLSLKDLSNEIESNGLIVHNIRRFTSRGTKNPSETVLVTTYGFFLPKEIKIYYSLVKINLFVDKPRQCLKCNKFSHSTKVCTNSTYTCSKCGGSHPFQDCSSLTPKCCNCSGLHSSTSPDCPAWKSEIQFLRFKCENHLSFSEARRRFKTLNSPHSFASITATSRFSAIDTKSSFIENFQNIVSSTVSKLVAEFSCQFEALVIKQEERFKRLLKQFTESSSTTTTDPITSTDTPLATSQQQKLKSSTISDSITKETETLTSKATPPTFYFFTVSNFLLVV